MLQPFFFFSFAPLPCGLEIETQPLHFFSFPNKMEIPVAPDFDKRGDQDIENIFSFRSSRERS